MEEELFSISEVNPLQILRTMIEEEYAHLASQITYSILMVNVIALRFHLKS